MKFVRNLLDKTKPKVREGKKPGLIYWLHDSLETFAFTPNHVTRKGVHIKDSIDLKRTMMMVIMAMMPCLIVGAWNIGHQADVAAGINLGYFDALWSKLAWGFVKILPLIVISYGVGLLVEFIFCTVKGHEINEGYLVSGMLIPLIMPVDVPLWIVAVSVIFAVIIGKEVFGGTGMNILNVALTARAFAFFAYPTQMTGNRVWIAGTENGTSFLASNGAKVDPVTFTGDVLASDSVTAIGQMENGLLQNGVDAFTGETPLGYMFNTVSMAQTQRAADKALQTLNEAGTYAGEKVDELNATIATMQHNVDVAVSKLPDTADMFFGAIPGSVGETSALACLIGAGLLVMTKIGSWRIMLSMLAGGYFMGLIFNAIALNPYMALPAHEQMMLGGFMFGLVFMATDPVTAAQTTTGKYIYGFFAGVFAISIRVFNPAYPEGVMLAILFMNVMAPMIDHYVVKANINRRAERAKKHALAHAA